MKKNTIASRLFVSIGVGLGFDAPVSINSHEP
jgi:hypothetical protein